jgi:exodeoxyribonuclease III
MKCISWNVNGFRAVHKRGDLDWLWKSGADIVFMQETKASEGQLDLVPLTEHGYTSFFSHSTARKGYSGVGTFVRRDPDRVEIGFGVNRFDEQGRSITLVFGDKAFVNVYVPNGGSTTASLPYKFDFLEEMLSWMEKLRKDGLKVFLGGDINIAHTSIDLARPEANANHTGFLPEERAWLDELFELGYVDVFRHLNPRVTDAYTYWDQRFGARERNVGWRIDYWIASPEAVGDIKDIRHLTDIYGSDHCPIELTLKD